jgi:hypothetical protein
MRNGAALFSGGSSAGADWPWASSGPQAAEGEGRGDDGAAGDRPRSSLDRRSVEATAHDRHPAQAQLVQGRRLQLARQLGLCHLGGLGDVLVLLEVLERLGQGVASAGLLDQDLIDLQQGLARGGSCSPGESRSCTSRPRRRPGPASPPASDWASKAGDLHLGGLAALDDIGQALLQGLDLVVRDADQGVGPLGHYAASLCRMWAR